ncbi:MAG: type I-U CRISPR-associated protein Cas8c [Betaproteobacteria bacterium]
MKTPEPNIQVPVDLTNPGQFFACCGLLELADRLWPAAEGWFERQSFCVNVERCRRDDCPLPKRVGGSLACGSREASRNHLSELLTEAKTLTFDVGDDDDSDDADDDKEDSGLVQPIELQWSDGRFAMHLDWWSDRSIKPWAGSMKERVILRAMLDAIDPHQSKPFDDLRRVQYQSPKLTKAGKPKKPAKKEPFYFDPRRGNKSHPLDCGFSPDAHKMEADCCPALEALCFIGLQRARPAPTDVANQSRYTVWTKVSDNAPGLPVGLVGPVTCGMIPCSSLGTYVFDNYFRTDQRKHKTFSLAQVESSQYVQCNARHV